MLTFYSKSEFSTKQNKYRASEGGIRVFIQLHHRINITNPFIYSMYTFPLHNVCCEHYMQHIKPSLSRNTELKKGV